jgi:FdrA protein
MKLMRVSEALASLSGVVRAAAVMATPLNVDLLADDGLLPPDVQASPEDLLVAVLGEDEASAERALAQVDALLTVQTWPTEGPGYRAGSEPLFQARTLDGAAGANLAVVAVPGPYAATEALAALRAGLHVFLFSDNVPLEEEVRLKRLAEERDLLMMGPDCGTAIIGGVGLGFANRVERGPVGIVGASGTGIQELCCLLDAAGVGIAQAIGTGGRDLSHAVGGSMTRRAIWALEAEEDVEIIAVISKPPDPAVARRLQGELLNLHKPAVVCLLGDREATFESTDPEAGPLR